MEQQSKKRQDWFILAGITLAYLFYLISINLPVERHVIHADLDDLIPFCEIFVVAYIWWYVFISVPLLWFFFHSREDFVYLGMYLLAGIWLCSIFFLIYPSSIDFQPQTFPRNNVFTWIVELLYAADEPVNVFPSIHCFESVAISIAIWNSKLWGKCTKMKVAGLVSAVLICLSTVLIKQHSILDLAAGVLLAFILYFPVYKINWSFRKRFE